MTTAFTTAQQAADQCLSEFLDLHPELIGVEDCESEFVDESGLFWFFYSMEDGTMVEVNTDGETAHASISDEG
jgi:hypothetical protein